MSGTDLDEIVTLSAQRTGNRPVALDGDVHDGDTHTHVLHVGDNGRHVLVTTDQDGIAQHARAGQGRQISLDIAVDTLPTSGSDLRGPKLDSGDVGDAFLFRGVAFLRHCLVPIAAQ